MKSIATVILSLYVLIGSAGMPFSMHTCFAIDETEYGFDLQDECCSPSEKPSQLFTFTKTECCDISSAYLQVDYEAISHNSFFNFEAPVALQGFAFSLVEKNTPGLLKSFEGRAPPLLFGRSLLSFIQSFLL